MKLFNNIFNYDYIQQKAQAHDNEQKHNASDSVKKLKEFLDSTEKTEPQYQKMASDEFCAVLLEYIQKHNDKKDK